VCNDSATEEQSKAGNQNRYDNVWLGAKMETEEPSEENWDTYTGHEGSPQEGPCLEKVSLWVGTGSSWERRRYSWTKILSSRWLWIRDHDDRNPTYALRGKRQEVITWGTRQADASLLVSSWKEARMLLHSEERGGVTCSRGSSDIVNPKTTKS